jgi:hypothetical protein
MNARRSIGTLGRVTVADGVHCRTFNDELMLLDLESGQYFSLNAVGTRMWSGLVEGRSPSEIAAALAGDYAVDSQVLLRDCISLADDLLERKLLRLKTP